MKKLMPSLLVLFLLAGFYLLRPPLLGGNVTYVMVSGISMEPTMHTGDLALAWRQGSYKTGDVVAFRAQEGERIGMVIHRVIGGNGQDGYRLQGDNNNHVDPWEPTQEQVLGKALVFIPRLGSVFGYLQDPMRMAIAVGVFFGYISLAGVILSYKGRSSRERRRLRREKAQVRARGIPGLPW